jgi:hypothetical protein
MYVGLKLQKNQLIKHLSVRRLYVDGIGTGSYYGPTTGNATAIHWLNTTIPISTNKLQYDAFATSNN